MGSPLSFIQHDKQYGSTYVLPYRFASDLVGKMPLFDKFLHDSWGHNDDYQQRRDALQEALYVSFMGRATKYQRAFLLYGLAQSGKLSYSKLSEVFSQEEAKPVLALTKWEKTDLS